MQLTFKIYFYTCLSCQLLSLCLLLAYKVPDILPRECLAKTFTIYVASLDTAVHMQDWSATHIGRKHSSILIVAHSQHRSDSQIFIFVYSKQNVFIPLNLLSP